ncbi:FliH/SctL family protein [Cellulomonas bogoriensis]
MSPETITTFRPAALVTPRNAATDDAAERSRAAGYAAGWAAGARAAAADAAEQARVLAERDAHAQARRDARLERVLAVLERAAVASSTRTVPTLQEARRTLHEGALALAAAVLQRELRPGPDSARAVLDRALQAAPEVGVHTVRMNADDLAEVRALLAEGQVQVPAGIELVADSRLEPGDVVSEYPGGYLDGQVGTALERARAALLEDAS